MLSTPHKPSSGRSWAGPLLALSCLGLLLGSGSCTAHLEEDDALAAPGTVVDSCPPGHTCTPNDDGTFVVVDNGGGFGAGNTTGSGGTVGSGGAVASGGTSGSNSTCTDTQHPDHPDKPCSVWLDWGECSSDWLSGYCEASCGRCTPPAGDGGTSGGGTGGGATGGGSGSGGNGMTLPDIQGGTNGWASRYWDCCKPHCAWSAHGGTAASCQSNGTTQADASMANACESHGSSGAFMCYSQAPRAVSNTVSYGYVAVPNPSCGQCFHIQFTGSSHNGGSDPGSASIGGKHMIVKVTNTGGDVAGNQFDLLIPGGGVGINPNTCAAQWGTSDLGPTHGGFLAGCQGSYEQRRECVRNKCNSVFPAGSDLRAGCLWFVDWFAAADNPNFRSQPIACPSDI